MSIARYAYLNARISAFVERLVPVRQLADYVDEDYAQCLRRSGTTRLDKIFAMGHAAPDRLEHAMLVGLLDEMHILLRPLRGAERDFLSYGVQLFELANLKAIIRGKFSNIPDAVVRDQLLDLGPFASLPLDRLLRTDDLAELLRVLEKTPYAGIARHVRRSYRDQHDLFAVDASIDRRYFIGLVGKTVPLERDQRGAVLRLLGTFLDRLSLVWLLRYRFAHGLSPAETLYLLVPSCGVLNAERLRALVPLESLDAVLAALPERLAVVLRGAPSTIAVEDLMEARLRHAAHTALRDMTHAIARTFAFFLLKDAELREVLALCKGKRLGFAPELIRVAARVDAEPQ